MIAMIALTRFRLSAYVRSLRVLQPLLAVFLLVALVLIQPPAGPSPAATLKLVVGGYGDTAALLFPIWAWAARGVLDTEPDGQRELSELAAGRAAGWAAGLLAGYLLNLALGVLAVAVPFAYGLAAGAGPGATSAAVALHVVAAVPATLLGAWTSRAVLPSTAVSILALLGGYVTLLLLGMGPLEPLSIPMIGWMRAAHAGPAEFTAAVPGLTAHIAVWSAVAAAGYVRLRRNRT